MTCGHSGATARRPGVLLPPEPLPRGPVKEKKRFRTVPVQRLSALTGAGVSVQAPIWAGLWAHHGFLRFPRLPSCGGWCRSHQGGRRIGVLLCSLLLDRQLRKWDLGVID